MAGKTKPGSALKGINIKLKMINDLMDVTGSAKDSWNPAEISDDMKAIAYIHRLADTWNPAQLNEALKYLGFDTIDSWNPAIIEETKNKLVKYFLPTEATGNPITFNTYGNLPYEVSKAEVTFLPKQSGTGDPSPDNVRPISGWTEVNLYVDEEQTLSPANTYTESLGQTVYGGNVDFVSGKCVIDRGIITLNGTETWIVSGGVFRTTVPNMLTKATESSFVSCCDHFRIAYADNCIVLGAVTTPNDQLYFRNNGFVADVDAWKTWLSSNNTTVIYPLETPIELTLTPQEIELLKGKNVIWTDGDNIVIEYKALLNS